MKKSVKKKDFNYIWDLVDVSVFIVVVYSLLDLIFQVNTYIDKLFPSAILNWAIILFAFGLIGYKSVRQNDKPNETAKFGAVAGLITGLAGAIISIAAFYFFPERFVAIIQQAVQQGADPAMIQTFMKIGIFAGLVISPAINAGIGALISWISSLIFKKK